MICPTQMNCDLRLKGIALNRFFRAGVDMLIATVALFCIDSGQVNFGLNASHQTQAMPLPGNAVLRKPGLRSGNYSPIDLKRVDDFQEVVPHDAGVSRFRQNRLDMV